MFSLGKFTKKKILQNRRSFWNLFGNRKLYDLVVIGGGSGGIACADEAAALGAKVALVDYVTPSPQGTKWRLGGTCVNVGCIPKKLMHYTANYFQYQKDMESFGIKSKSEFDWNKMVENIQNTIHSLNFNYRASLRSRRIDYYNAYASYIDRNHIELKYDDDKDEKQVLECLKSVVAVGLRPKYPDIPGAVEYGITSDDLFSLSHPPGKTLIVGASYIALETAGMLNSLGYDVTVMVRSIILRGFDRDMSEYVKEDLINRGVRFINKTVPISLSKKSKDSKIEVKYNRETEEFDTVLFAIGRKPVIDNLHLERVNVLLDKNSNKIIAEKDQTSCEDIYAIGDIVHGRPELTPTAAQAGRYLARRLYSLEEEDESRYIDYRYVPTCVFTPTEYAHVGYSEEKANELYGKGDVNVYHAKYDTIEGKGSHRTNYKGDPIDSGCYTKIICTEKENDKIIGIHILGDNASEIIQGFSVAMSRGITKSELDNCTGLHPTHGEEILKIAIPKKLNIDFDLRNC